MVLIINGNIEETKSWIGHFQDAVLVFFTRFASQLKYIASVLCLVGYFIYFSFAIHYDLKKAIPLIALTSLTVLWFFYKLCKEKFGRKLYKAFIKPYALFLLSQWPTLKWFLGPLLAISIIVYIMSIITSRRQVQSVIGLVVFMFVPLITCKYPNHIKMRPVIWGMAFQFLLGIVVLRTRIGFQSVEFIADQFNKFLFYSMEGGSIVFGDPMLFLHPFLMIVVPMVIYLGGVVALLYYFGIIQAFVKKLGFFMRITLGTTGIESVSLVLNIFLDVTQTMLVVKPYLSKLTDSEFHTLLVGCHTTIAGFAYAIIILVGVSPQHLLTAAVMSAPAAVAISKLNYPETQVSQYKKEDDFKISIGNEGMNVVEAISRSAYDASKTVVSLAVQLITFLSFYKFLDVTLAWFGSRIGIEISFQIIFSYCFMPLAWLTGIDWAETSTVGEVLGLKLTANELLAFFELGKLIRNDEISEKAASLATYAICGFSSIGTLAIFVGVWMTVDPSRVNQVSSLLPRVYMNCNLACFVTACVAGVLYDEEVISSVSANDAAFGGGSFLSILNLLPKYESILPLLGIG